MASTTSTKVTRRGFRNAPATTKAAAERLVREFAEATSADAVLAQLRPATYCGPGSAGERGDHVLSLNGGGRFALHTVA